MRFQNGGFQLEFWLRYLQRTALELKIISITSKFFLRDGYHLTVVTGMRFWGTKIQTLQQPRDMSAGFLRLRLLNFKVSVIVFLIQYLVHRNSYIF